MNREDGFPIADVDVNLFHDPKVKALVRATRDEHVTAVHLALYTALVLQSWAAGDRVPLDDALPAWWFADIEDSRTALIAAGLIDDESRIPVDDWEVTYLVAFNRREKRRESGAEGGRRSWQSRRDKRRRSDASPTPNPSVLPSGRPTDRPDEEAMPSPIADASSGTATSNGDCGYCGKPILATPTWVPSLNANAHGECHRKARAELRIAS